MEQQQNIIITDNLNDIGKNPYKEYLGHALCLDGSCRIVFNGAELEMKQGDLMIVRRGKLVEKVMPGKDFRVTMVYISPKLIELATPQSNYGMKGQLALFLNPIMHLNSTQFEQCKRNFDNLQIRMLQTGHKFYNDMILNKVQSLIIDFFDFHATLYKESDVSTQYATLMNRYTTLDISRLLRDKTLSFVQISDMFNFSSPAYFSRYVLHNLGVNPTEYRN